MNAASGAAPGRQNFHVQEIHAVMSGIGPPVDHHRNLVRAGRVVCNGRATADGEGHRATSDLVGTDRHFILGPVDQYGDGAGRGDEIIGNPAGRLNHGCGYLLECGAGRQGGEQQDGDELFHPAYSTRHPKPGEGADHGV